MEKASHNQWARAGIAIFIVLYLCYSPTFLSDYLINDELSRIGRHASFSVAFKNFFLKHGRPFFGIYETLVYDFVGYSPFRVQIVRFVNFLSLSSIGILLFVYITLKSRSQLFALCFVIFFFSQPSIYTLMGYSLQLISNSQPAMWFSLVSFFMHFKLDRFFNGRSGIRHGIVFTVIMLSMFSTQTYAFFSMIPLCAGLLFEDIDHRRVRSYYTLCLLSFLLSFVLFKVSVDYQHANNTHAYVLGEQAVEIAMNNPLSIVVKALNPISYWSAFKIWNYPFPLHTTAAMWGTKKIIALMCLAGWSLVVVIAFILNIRDHKLRPWVLHKWLLILFAFGFSAIPITADSPTLIVEHRPHVTLTFSGLLIVTGFWSFATILRPIPRIFKYTIKLIGVSYIVIALFGAQAAILRNIVDLRSDQLDFIRAEIAGKIDAGFSRIFVVMPEKRICPYEPCGHWTGTLVGLPVHESSLPRYKYALSSLGIDPETKQIKILAGRDHISSLHLRQVIIDWNKYIRSKMYENRSSQ